MRIVRRLMVLALPTATAATICDLNIAQRSKIKIAFCLDDTQSSFDRRFPRTKWDTNWDSRDTNSLINQRQYDRADDAKRQQLLSDATSTATRNLILIRHGEFHRDGERNLTDLGREQARLLGLRLAAMRPSWEKLTLSTMRRATDTANIAASALDPEIRKESDVILEEGIPYPAEPSNPLRKKKAFQFLADGSRIEAAFRKYIHRADPRQKQESFELIFCHANVIRYFVFRALQLPPEAFRRFEIAHASITWLVILPTGEVSLKFFGDVAHIPQEQITF